jgi:pyruvate-formate lyase-activating enzyme
LNLFLTDFEEKTLAVTGGEPLQKAPFLREWLPTVRPRFKILLETAGVHVSEFREIVEWVDIVGMDFKLPSATGMHPWWREHEAFLRMAQGKDVYIKVVLTGETEEKDILRGIELVASIDPSIPFILQPATPFGRFRSVPSIEQVAHWQDLVQKTLSHVRVIPQIHKQMGIL